MKKGQFSYINGRQLSHASLQKFRRQSQQAKVDSFTKDMFPSKPNVKYYTNENNNNVVNKLDFKKMQNYLKNQQQLRKKNKILQCELKKKINEHSYLVKLFKTKNTSELSHIDIYLQFKRIQEDLETKIEEIKQLGQKNQQYAKQIQDLLHSKDEQQRRHTNQINTFFEKVQKLQKKYKLQLSQIQKQLGQERKIKQQKDILLKQIRRKYQQSQKTIQNMKVQLNSLKSSKQNIQVIYQQKIENTKQNLLIKLQETNKQTQKYKSKIKQLQGIIKNSNEKYAQKSKQDQMKLKQLQAQIKDKDQQINDKDQLLHQKHQKIIALTQQCKITQSNIFMHAQQISNLKKSLKMEQQNHKAESEHFIKQISQQKQTIRQNSQKCQKYLKQLSKLQQRLAQANSTIKVLSFQRQDKQAGIDKISASLIQKQKILHQKQKLIQQLETKSFTAERKVTLLNEKVKQLQCQLLSNKQFNAFKSKLQIDNYKCIGRITQLINQIHNININSKQNKSQNLVFANKGKNHKKQLKTKNQFVEPQLSIQQPQTITQSVDMLAKIVQTFIKCSHNENTRLLKQSNQFNQQVVCDIKSILHAYNSYIQDQQLKGATRQYIQCLQLQNQQLCNGSSKHRNKKQRNCYMQVIMQRLFSIIAVHCYASENGLLRKTQSKTKINANMQNKKILDSLQNTHSKWQQTQDQSKGYYQPIIHRVDSKRKLHNEQQKYKRHKDSKKKIISKMNTQPNQIQDFPVRKLDYYKQNLMQRINRPLPIAQPQNNKYYNYLSNPQPQETQPRRNYQTITRNRDKDRDRDRDRDREWKNEGNLQLHIKQNRKQKRHAISNVDDAIEKKYFR